MASRTAPQSLASSVTSVAAITPAVRARFDWLAIAALTGALLVGFIVRVWAIGAVGFNSDEAVYAGQAAALAGDPTYSKFFAIFRAHPLLVQFLLSVVFLAGMFCVLRWLMPDWSSQWAALVAVILFLPLVGVTFRYSRTPWIYYDRWTWPDDEDVTP